MTAKLVTTVNCGKSIELYENSFSRDTNSKLIPNLCNCCTYLYYREI